ncbi:hypothetical protein PAXRUDRAFT_305896 [Paxillus rubicundulus Ve08.2h10]|uniref:Uncharacterized protein n=1 Tax=Paxillus rubicundulus Ve08.2h10 TaxID=930991 RepID=A0A0D0DFK1_9AGAM|nr:hypothetical protein PAXRUDRAFT_305896 [Paxillus rubicundulus Ve08.2h10]
MACFNNDDPSAPMLGARTRTRSTSHSSVTSQSSMLSIYDKIHQGSPVAEPTEGHTNAYGSFTTTAPAAFWLRTHLKLNIPNMRRPDDDYDTPPDSPLSFFHPLSSSRRSPSITRTLSTGYYGWDEPSTSSPSSPSLSAPASPLMDHKNTGLHPVLEAVEKGSKFSYRTVCATCMKAGRDFPRCAHCGDMWCSRECRLQGGKKHICVARKMYFLSRLSFLLWFCFHTLVPFLPLDHTVVM